LTGATVIAAGVIVKFAAAEFLVASVALTVAKPAIEELSTKVAVKAPVTDGNVLYACTVPSQVNVLCYIKS